jgi:hypothetical protein
MNTDVPVTHAESALQAVKATAAAWLANRTSQDVLLNMVLSMDVTA